MVTEPGVFVQITIFKPCLDLKLQPHKRKVGDHFFDVNYK